MTADPLTIIERAAAALAVHPDEDIRLVADWLREGARGDLFDYLGTSSTRGHSARLEAAYQRRNSALRDLARLRWPDLSPREAGRLLAAELARYHARCWPRDRHQLQNPHHPDSARALLWTALRAVPRPLGAAQTARILGGAA